MSFPKNINELERAGYRFKSACLCDGCRARIQFWRTPQYRNIPLDVAPNGDVTPHWATCPKADDFRRKKHGEKESTQKSKAGQASTPTKTTPGNDR